MSEANARAWLRIARDAILVCVATFIAIHETLASRDPNFYLLAFSATLYGIPPALRWDEKRFRESEDGKANGKDKV
jgi:hypothetical protein